MPLVVTEVIDALLAGIGGRPLLKLEIANREHAAFRADCPGHGLRLRRFKHQVVIVQHEKLFASTVGISERDAGWIHVIWRSGGWSGLPRFTLACNHQTKSRG